MCSLNPEPENNTSQTHACPFEGEDAKEYGRMGTELVELLKKSGRYEPAVDDIAIDTIARNSIYLRRVGRLLQSDTADAFTYARVTDSQAKYAKMIADAI